MPREHTVSVVVPVYRGGQTLEPLVEELVEFTRPSVTPDGHSFRVTEVLLVYDNGPDDSDVVIRKLADEHDFVQPVWLARNSGQHAATAAGVASSGGTWIVTMDEDGQHVPSDIGQLLDVAIQERVLLVYGHHSDEAPHAWWRNVTSRVAKRMARWLAGADIGRFSSFRLMEGKRARSVTAYIGPRTFFDLALTWAFDRSVQCEITSRSEWRQGSGYSLKSLLSHFWTLVLSSGTRPLRAVTLLGFIAAMVGFVTSAVIAIRRISSDYQAPGWASTITIQLVVGGLILVTLGVVAEYVGALLRSAQGKPLYIVLDDPENGPLGGSFD